MDKYLWLILFLVGVIAVIVLIYIPKVPTPPKTTSSITINFTSTTTIANNITLPSNCTIQYTKPDNYDEQIILYSNSNTRLLDYNISVTPQQGNFSQVSYLLNGALNDGYWYQFGLAFNKGEMGLNNSNFLLIAQVYKNGTRITPPLKIPTTGPISANDTVKLLLFPLYNYTILMQAFDWNTDASASACFTPTYFVPNCNINSSQLWQTNQSVFIGGNKNNGFTGPMTEVSYTNSLVSKRAYKPVIYKPILGYGINVTNDTLIFALSKQVNNSGPEGGTGLCHTPIPITNDSYDRPISPLFINATAVLFKDGTFITR